MIDRRKLLQGSMLAGGLDLLDGCTAKPPRVVAGTPGDGMPALAPIRASTDRIFDITVCLRPFRATGPRLDTERIGDTLVVHNYGHGGSGWSLSWGSAEIAVRQAMAASPREIAVIGCGAIGLTSAILAQRAGAKVTIYAADFMPATRSARATGSWTPDSRIALASAAGPGFGAVWEQMARSSFKTYRNYLGLPGTPVEWTDRYTVSDTDLDAPAAHSQSTSSLDFGEYRQRIRDLTPRERLMPASIAPFDAPYVYRSESLMFNIADYGHTLMNDFMIAGGKMQCRLFNAPADIADLTEKTVINCTGYGARALWNDQQVTPVRGQIGWLIPQPEVDYGVYYKDVYVLSRRDGIVVQALEGGDMKGYGNTDETADRAEAERAVTTVAELYTRLRAPRSS